MAACRRPTRRWNARQARRRWTTLRCPPYARRIRSSRCQKSSTGRTCGSEFSSCIICLSITSTSRLVLRANQPNANRGNSFVGGARAAGVAPALLEIFRMSAGATPLPQLVAVLGPTGSGKSSLGIELARKLNGEVLACDSTQVYRHFDIGTAKVPPAERQGIPHHLLDLVEPSEVFTAGEYRRRALEVLADVTARGRLPILTAGTGLYLRALIEGLSDAPERSEDLRARLREMAQEKGAEYLHRLLARLDPVTGRKI